MNFGDQGKQFYKDCKYAIDNLRPLIKEGAEFSSQDYNQGIDNALDYTHMNFWSSKGSETPEENEFLIYELIDTSIIASVHFMPYRSQYESRPIYPSQKVQIKIGNNKNNYHYESEIYDIEPRNKYFTVLVLPEIVVGKYVKFELIGKVTPQPGDEKFYTVIEFVDCIGYPLQNLSADSPLAKFNTDAIDMNKCLQESLVRQHISAATIELLQYINANPINVENLGKLCELDYEHRTPFLMYRLIKENLIDKYLDDIYERKTLNKVESYIYVERKSTAKVSPYELIGDLLYDRGLYGEAGIFYQNSGDFWNVAKVLIKQRNYIYLKELSDNDFRIPKLSDIIEMAQEMGEDYVSELNECFNFH